MEKIKKEIRELASNRGFTLYASAGSSDIFMDTEVEGISLTYYYDTDEFELSYMIPHSIFSIKSPDRIGSFSSDNQWNRMINKIRYIVNKYNQSEESEEI